MRIEVKDLSYVYSAGLPYETKALDGINFVAEEGDFIAIVGSTGSGKTTLVEHLNGLLKPTTGQVLADGVDINSKDPEARKLRRQIGIVFQYPEYQLFEESVIKDVMFGPKNQGFSEAECKERAVHAMNLVGIDPEKYGEVSPFALSGGQKRRVAIAGVLAMNPKVLILDEPTAGLDPKGRRDILEMITRIKDEQNLTIFLVSHNMDDVVEFASRVIVLKRGTIRLMGTPRDVFHNLEEVIAAGLDLPQGPSFSQYLLSRGVKLKRTLTFDETVDEIVRVFKKE
ncbi:MAG: energy-coupling factor transporter ATPase [Firmicutes bacterium]|nr:energy-coupling factor transporter ATPase [Bacillota bacterium]